MTESTTSRPEADQDLTDSPTSLDTLDAGGVVEETTAADVENAAAETAAEQTPAIESPVESDRDPAEDSSAGSGVTDNEDADDEGGDSEDGDGDDEDGDGDGDDEDGDDEDGDAAAPKASKGSRAKQLEREGEVAADFLETLLDIADLDGDIEVDIDGDRAAVAIVDSDEGRVPRRLVGTQGKVLEALQELTRLAVQTATGERSRLMLDVAGHRAERRTTLVELAKVAIAEVKESGEKKALDDMTAFERKVIHDEVAGAGLDSESEGVEPHRHIVILPV